MPAISIVVPVYNAEKYLDRCLESIYKQTFKDYEIILVNDGSSDNSLEICKTYALNDKRIKVIDKENEGSGPTRTRGLLEAKGEYLAFPDVDDYFEANMYEDLYKLAKEFDADIVFSGANHYFKDEQGNISYGYTSTCKKVNFKNKKECQKGIMDLFPTTTIFDVPWNKLYKRELAIKNNVTFKPLKRCQDAVFNLDMYYYANKVVSSDKAYYNYIENSKADVYRKFPKDYKDIIIYYNAHLKEVLYNMDVYYDDIKLHYDTTFILGLYSAITMCNNPNWQMNYKDKRAYILDIINDEYVLNRINDVVVREDSKKILTYIMNKDVDKILMNMKIEDLKDKLRDNKLVMNIYRLVKR